MRGFGIGAGLSPFSSEHTLLDADAVLLDPSGLIGEFEGKAKAVIDGSRSLGGIDGARLGSVIKRRTGEIATYLEQGRVLFVYMSAVQSPLRYAVFSWFVGQLSKPLRHPWAPKHRA